MKEANNIRLVCPEFLEAVTSFPWMDAETRISGNLEKWRKIFPYARAVNVSYREDVVDADFVHIRGDARVQLHTVNISKCLEVTDAAFVHLHGIHTLNMGGCSQETITDSAFENLRGIQSITQYGLVQTGDDYRCSFCEIEWNSYARHDTMQSGDDYRCSFCEPTWDLLAQHARLRSGDYY